MGNVSQFISFPRSDLGNSGEIPKKTIIVGSLKEEKFIPHIRIRVLHSKLFRLRKDGFPVLSLNKHESQEASSVECGIRHSLDARFPFLSSK